MNTRGARDGARPREGARHFAPLHKQARASGALLLAACALVAAHATVRAQATAKSTAAASATIAGRITADGKPAAQVGVVLVPDDYSSQAKTVARAVTDAEGRYRMTNVPAGRYRLRTTAPLYASPEELKGGVYLSGKQISVGANEAVEDADLALVRGGVVTGRVMNAEGKPVVGEYVTLINADAGARRSLGDFTLNPYDFETDDRGIYRIYGVPPGRYLVSVGQARDNNSVHVGGTWRYTRTFYPNTTDAAQAKPVEIASGGESAGVDISAADAPRVYEARGKIVDEAGKAVAGVGYGFGPLADDDKQIGAWGAEATVTDAEGQFVVHGLMPGRYAVFAVNAYGSNELGDSYTDAAAFEITDADASGLVVKVHRGASLSGTVVVEGTSDRAVVERLMQLQIMADVSVSGEGPVAPNYTQAKIASDGTFRIAGVRPGRAKITIWSYGLSSPFTLLGVERGGVDASSGIDLAPGAHVADVRVRVGYGTHSLRGQLDVRDGTKPASLPESARLWVVPQRAGGGMDYEKTVGVDSRGRFNIDNLLAGEYELTIYGSLPSSAANSGGRLPTVRQKITITDAVETLVTVVYDLSRQTEHTP